MGAIFRSQGVAVRRRWAISVTRRRNRNRRLLLLLFIDDDDTSVEVLAVLLVVLLVLRSGRSSVDSSACTADLQRVETLLW